MNTNTRVPPTIQSKVTNSLKGSLLDLIQRDYQFIAGEKIQEMFASDVVNLIDSCYKDPWKMDVGQVVWYGVKVDEKPNYGKNSKNTALTPVILTVISEQDLEMKNVIQKLAEWTGKVIIPCDEVMGQKISIYSPTKVRRSRALALMFAALRNKGFVAEHMDDTIFLKPVAKTKLLSVPTIPPEVPLARLRYRCQDFSSRFRARTRASCSWPRCRSRWPRPGWTPLSRARSATSFSTRRPSWASMSFLPGTMPPRFWGSRRWPVTWRPSLR